MIAAGVLIGCLCRLAGAEVKEGPVTLSEHDGASSSSPTVTMGKVVKMTGDFHVIQFFGAKVIDCGVKVKNTGKQPMYCIAHVAFFDKDNHLLGCVSQGSMGALKPDETTELASMLVSLPLPELKKVASYQVAFHESENKI